MYPLDVFNLFPPFPRNNNVFVAMNFDKKSDNRWKNVIEPAIREVGLDPFRVDKKTISDSIITEIVSGISNCRLFFADLSCYDKLNDRPIRNENVLYEVGIAHSRRLPEEVILFRSDNEKLMFDLANIRVNYYNPDGEVNEAKNLIIEALKSALREIDIKKHFAVQHAAESLTVDSRACLLDSRILQNSNTALILERSKSIHQLIELGIIKASYSDFNSRFFDEIGKLKPEYIDRFPAFGSGMQTKNNELYYSYEITPFGFAVMDVVKMRIKNVESLNNFIWFI